MPERNARPLRRGLRIERSSVPAALVAGKVPDRARERRGSLADGPPPAGPYACEASTSLAARPIHPFPAIPRPDEDGYARGPSPAGAEPVRIDWYGTDLIGPDFQRDHRIEDGRLVALPR